MNMAVARHNMIEQQIRPWEVLDERVLNLIEQTPREDFVPEGFTGLAYADVEIPLGEGQAMMAPRVEARLLQALAVKPTDTVLEVGTGSGYVTALLAKSAARVHSVDIIPGFTALAKTRLAAVGLGNVTLETGDAAAGWPEHGPYDVIAVTGSLPMGDKNFRKLLKSGGRLFAVTGTAPVMEASLVTRLGENQFVEEALFETVLAPLINAPAPRRFDF
ncbi:MAG TPA: protein-L-isoaspartate O-methyltransferase [Gammaproteobacteria bacterium]|nr:protein-L-isoaspartate O-methyltransferase [Gammaproteobacteria bacterium]